MTNQLGQPILLLPRDGKLLLLDIEGTTTSISFVKDELFPYITDNVSKYLQDTIKEATDNRESLNKLKQLRQDLQEDLKVHGLEQAYSEKNGKAAIQSEEPPAEQDLLVETITGLVKYLVENDVKGKHLKDFQGIMWKRGYEQGLLFGHVYADVLPTFQWMAQHGIPVCIYSSGSVQAQKLLFRYSTSGNLIHFLSGHFDINNAGPKREVKSYQTIVESLKGQFQRLDAKDVIFVSDVEQEVEAADQAGLQAVLSIRPGNAPCSDEALKRFAQVHSLMQLCGGEKGY